MFTKIFEELGLSVLTQKVFNELLDKGPTTAKQLADRVNIPRPSVYDHLKILIQKGLVMEKIMDEKKVFLVDDLKNIQELLDNKIKVLQEEKKRFDVSLSSLLNKVGFTEPQIKFYSGKEGVKQVLNHIMTNRNIKTELFWPMSEMMKVLGPEYLEELNTKRIQRNIYLRAIWPLDKKVDVSKYPYLAGDESHLRDLKFTPEGMTWNMGYWMYENRVAFLSSEKEGFGFVVHSKEFADLMRLQFEQMWKIAKK